MKRLAMTALAAIAVVSCGDDPLGPEHFRVATLVATHTQGPWFRAGDTVDVTVYVTNLTNEDHMVDASLCPPKFTVKNLDGVVVAPIGYLCTAELKLQTARPGDVLIYNFKWWGQTTYLTKPGESPTYLPPGTYHVQGFIQVQGVGIVNGSTTTIQLQQPLTSPPG